TRLLLRARLLVVRRQLRRRFLRLLLVDRAAVDRVGFAARFGLRRLLLGCAVTGEHRRQRACGDREHQKHCLHRYGVLSWALEDGSRRSVLHENRLRRAKLLRLLVNAPCPAEETVLAYVEGGLAPDLVESVDDHLDSCPSCRRLLLLVAKSPSLDAT